jgi:hypothetical protein
VVAAGDSNTCVLFSGAAGGATGACWGRSAYGLGGSWTPLPLNLGAGPVHCGHFGGIARTP